MSQLPSREVTDAELEEAAARVRRHAWRERLAMGTAMLVGFAGLAGWVASGIALVFLGGLFVGSLVYGGLRPKHDPLEEPPVEDGASADARAEMQRQIRRGWLAWLASHVGEAMVGRLAIALGLALGLAGGWAARTATGMPLSTCLGAGAVAGVVLGATVGLVLGRRVRRAIDLHVRAG